MAQKTHGLASRKCPRMVILAPPLRAVISTRKGWEKSLVDLAGSERYAYYLCDDCRRRNAEREVEYQAERAKKRAAEFATLFARLEPLCQKWLRQAPQLAELPDPVGTFPAGPRAEGFVEVFDEVTATELVVLAFMYDAPLMDLTDLVLSHRPDGHFFRISYPRTERRTVGYQPFQPPSTFEGVLKRSEPMGDDVSRWWKGSICRLVDGRIVLHWRFERWFDRWAD